MEFFLQTTLNGVLMGSIYALIGIGFVLIYKTGGFFNFAHGQMLVIGSCLAFYLSNMLELNFYLAVLLSMSFSMLLSVVFHRILSIEETHHKKLVIALMSLGIASIINGVMLMTPFGVEVFRFPSLFTQESLSFFGLIFSTIQIFGALFAWFCLGCFLIIYNFTNIGLKFKAVFEDVIGAELCGVSSSRMFRLSWVLTGIATTIAGVIASLVSGMKIEVLAEMGVLTFPVIVLGGMDSIMGSVVGGILIGVCQQYCIAYLDQALSLRNSQSFIPYVFLVIMLLIKPHGLLGQKERSRV